MFLVMVPDSLEGFERLSFIVFRLVLFCLSAVLGQCYCVLKKKWYPHSHTHFVFVHIRHFYKKKWRVLVLIKRKDINVQSNAWFWCCYFLLHLLKVKSYFWKHEQKYLYAAVVNDLQCSGIWIYLKADRISSGRGGMFVLQDTCAINIWDWPSSYRFFLTNFKECVTIFVTI